MREFIDKEIMIQEYRSILGCEIDTEYKHVSDDGVCERTVKNLIEDANTYTEQEIVKPYFNRLKQVMKERNEDNGGEPLNAIDKGYNLAFEHMCLEIDNLMSEQEK